MHSPALLSSRPGEHGIPLLTNLLTTPGAQDPHAHYRLQARNDSLKEKTLRGELTECRFNELKHGRLLVHAHLHAMIHPCMRVFASHENAPSYVKELHDLSKNHLTTYFRTYMHMSPRTEVRADHACSLPP